MSHIFYFNFLRVRHNFRGQLPGAKEGFCERSVQNMWFFFFFFKRCVCFNVHVHTLMCTFSIIYSSFLWPDHWKQQKIVIALLHLWDRVLLLQNPGPVSSSSIYCWLRSQDSDAVSCSFFILQDENLISYILLCLFRNVFSELRISSSMILTPSIYF